VGKIEEEEGKRGALLECCCMKRQRNGRQERRSDMERWGSCKEDLQAEVATDHINTLNQKGPFRAFAEYAERIAHAQVKK
jgi:hypothetical protein